MGYCKIVKITDRTGEDKLYDDDATRRIGMILNDVMSTISVGGKGIFYCVYPKADKTVFTSRIKSVTTSGDITIVETNNSFYYLKKVGDLE